MRIGIDVDGILADFISGYNELITQQTGIQMPPSSDSYPDVWEYDVKAGLTRDQLSNLWKTITTTEFWGKLHALPEALDVLAQLSAMRYSGHHIYFITNRPGERAKFLSERWLALAGMPNPTVLIAVDKGSVIKGLELDVMIDDYDKNIVNIVQGSPKTRTYILDRPYNRHFNDEVLVAFGENAGYVPVTRVKSVTEMLQRELTPVTIAEAA